METEYSLIVYKSHSLVSDVSHTKVVILKMEFNMSSAPLISYPNGHSGNFCNVCSLISAYSLSGCKRQQITIYSVIDDPGSKPDRKCLVENKIIYMSEE